MVRGAFVAGPVHAVDQQDVLPAVVIVIEERAAGAESFGEEFAAVGAGIVVEVDAGGGGDVYQAEVGLATDCCGGELAR